MRCVNEAYADKTMRTEQEQLCPRHEVEMRMRMRSLHSDVSRPDQVVALYECPECGHERRVPVEPAA
jgi:hypothetical protein